VGSGDAFLAGYVAARYQGSSPEECLRFGVACGAESTRRLGAGLVAPREVVMTNVEGALNVLSAAVGGGARILQMSSSEVYGTAQYTPIDELHPLDAQSPYAASKVGADKLAESFHMAFGVPVVVARPFNTYGPRQSLRAVIPVVIAQALAGGELTLGSLTPTRDFVFVGDTVEGLIRLLSSDEATQGATFNIATGRDISVADVVTMVGELLGRELRVRSVDERLRPEKSEVHQLLGDRLRDVRVHFGLRDVGAGTHLARRLRIALLRRQPDQHRRGLVEERPEDLGLPLGEGHHSGPVQVFDMSVCVHDRMVRRSVATRIGSCQ